jgi:hypothetical protein
MWRWSGAAVVVAALLAVAGTAMAQTQSSTVVVDRAPTLSGTLRVGQTLNAGGGHWRGPSGTQTTWAWLRCNDNTPNSTVSQSQESQLDGCSVVRSGSASYTLTNDDLNKFMRLVLYAYAGSGRSYQDDYMSTAPSTQVVAAASNAPAPTPTPVAPTPSATPVATVAPTPVPTFDPQPTASPVPTSGQVLHATTRRVIRPFPVVRMKGRLTSSGANVTRFTVRAPKAAHIKVTCSGPCPTRRWSKGARKSRLTRLAPFERVLRSGARIAVTVTRHGYIGKQTVFRIRRGQAPLRSDRCVNSSGRRTTCPAGV